MHFHLTFTSMLVTFALLSGTVLHKSFEIIIRHTRPFIMVFFSLQKVFVPALFSVFLWDLFYTLVLHLYIIIYFKCLVSCNYLYM